MIVTGLENESGETGQRTGKAASVVVEIDGKQHTLTEEALKGLVGKGDEYSRLKDQVTPFQNVLTKYGVDAKDYISNAEASFALANTLIEKGIIDQQGNILEKKAAPTAVTPITFGGGGNRDSGADKAILDALAKVTERLDTVESGQSQIWQKTLEADVKAAYSNLNGGDVTKILAKAKADRSKSFWGHAATMSQEKASVEKEEKTGTAKEVIALLVKAGIVPDGQIDLATLDLDKLKEQDLATKPSAFAGKKFVFKDRLQRLKTQGADISKFADPKDGMREIVGNRLR